MKFNLGKMKFNIPILHIINESDVDALDILIEPHLELYQLPPGKSCDVLYPSATDNTIPDKTLGVAQREDCMVIYPPGPYAPDLVSEGVKLKNLWG